MGALGVVVALGTGTTTVTKLPDACRAVATAVVAFAAVIAVTANV